MRINKKRIRSVARLHGYQIYRGWLSRTENWSEELRRDYVFKRLRWVLTRANRDVPYYRKVFSRIGFDPKQDFKEIEDMARIPILEKEDIRENLDSLVSRQNYPLTLVANTSGTTGMPISFLLNESYVALDYGVMCRHWARAGYSLRSKFAALRSYVPDNADSPLWKFSLLENSLYMSAYHLTEQNCDDYVDAICEFKPRFLRGYPSALAVFAEFAYSRREELRNIKGVFTASEVVTQSEREGIERTFGKVLFDWYGMTEPAVVMTERESHDGMEVEWEYGYPEFEKTGESDVFSLIATSLHNPVMPLIRYRTGDSVVIGDVNRIGENLIYPTIDRIIGRKDEAIVTPNGDRLPTLNFYSLLQEVNSIIRFQLIQDKLHSIELRVLVREISREKEHELREWLYNELKKRLGGVVPRIVFTEKFVKNRNGKTPVLISYVNGETKHDEFSSMTGPIPELFN